MLATVKTDSKLVAGGDATIDAAGVVGAATWHGPDLEAAESRSDVEIEVRETIDWTAIHPAGSDSPMAHLVAGAYVQGHVLDVDEHGVATLQLLDGGILLLDTAGRPPVAVMGSLIAFSVSRLHVFPTNI